MVCLFFFNFVLDLDHNGFTKIESVMMKNLNWIYRWPLKNNFLNSKFFNLPKQNFCFWTKLQNQILYWEEIKRWRLKNNLFYRKVVSRRPVYYLILNSLDQRSQYISIKFPLHKQFWWSLRFRYSEKAIKFEKIFRLTFDATE